MGSTAQEPVGVLVPAQLTWQEYDGLRIYQLLLSPQAGRVTIDLEQLRREHPDWVASLQAAHEYLTRFLFNVQHQGRLARSRNAKDVATTRRVTAQALRAQGLPLRVIAERLGVSTGTVSSYCKGIPRPRRRPTT